MKVSITPIYCRLCHAVRRGLSSLSTFMVAVLLAIFLAACGGGGGGGGGGGLDPTDPGGGGGDPTTPTVTPPVSVVLSPPNDPNETDHATEYAAEYNANPALGLMGAAFAYNRNYYGQGAVVGIAGEFAVARGDGELGGRVVNGVRYDVVANVGGWRTDHEGYTDGATETSLARAIGGAQNAPDDTEEAAGHGVAFSVNLMPIALSQRGTTNFTSAFSWLFDENRAPDIILLKDWKEDATAPYRITGTYDSTTYVADIPLFRTFLDDLDDNYAALGAQFTDEDDTAIVVPAGNQGWNSVGDVYLCPPTQDITHYCLAGNSDATLTASVSTEEFITGFNPNGDDIDHLYTLDINFGADDSHGISYLPTYHSNFLHRFINVVAVMTVVDGGVTVTTIASHSNSCGNTKNWCISAPIDPATDSNLQTETAAAHVAGALALLRSRHPSQPMSVIIAILFETANDEIGAADIYGHGLVNIAAAISLHGEQNLVLASVSQDPNVEIVLEIEAAAQVTAEVTATDGTRYTLTLSNPTDTTTTLTLADTSQGHYAITLNSNVTMIGGNPVTLNSNIISVAFSANFDSTLFSLATPSSYASFTNHVNFTVFSTLSNTTLTVSTADHGYYIPDTVTFVSRDVTTNMAGTLTITDIEQVPDDHKASVRLVTGYLSTTNLAMDVYTVSAITYLDWQGNVITPPGSGGNSGGNVGGGLGSLGSLGNSGLSDLFIHQLQALGITLSVTISNYAGQPFIYSDATLSLDVYDGYVTVINITHYTGGYVTVTPRPYGLTITAINNPAPVDQAVGLTIGSNQRGRLAYAILPQANSHATSNGAPFDFSAMPEYQRQPGLAAISAHIAYQRGYFGQGVTVMVIDSGVAGNHADLSSRLAADGLVMGVEGGNTVVQEQERARTEYTDSDGHGTFVAGIIAARLNETGVHGVAPDATILPANAWQGGRQLSETMLRFALTTRDTKYQVPIINNSWGFLPNYHLVEDGDGNRRQALIPALNYFIENEASYRTNFRTYADAIADNDTVLVFAAGNDWWNSATGQVNLCATGVTQQTCYANRGGSGANYSSVPITTFLADYSLIDGGSTTPFSSLDINPDDSPGYALMPLYHYEFIGKLVNVVAVDSNNVIANFSNACGSSKHWCIAAPGVAITSLARGGEVEERSGTSAAAAHVSGALAVLKSRFPSMPMSVILAILFETADDSGNLGNADIYGHGLLNLGRAATVQGSVQLVLAPDNLLHIINPTVATNIDGTLYSNFSVYSEYTNLSNSVYFNQMNVAEAFNRGYFGQGVTVANIGPLARTGTGESKGLDNEISAHNRNEHTLTFLSSADNESDSISVGDGTNLTTTLVSTNVTNIFIRERDTTSGNRAHSYGALVALGGGLGADSNIAGTSPVTSTTAFNVMGVAPSVSFIHVVTETNDDLKDQGSTFEVGIYRESVLEATRFMATTTDPDHDVQIINNHWIMHADWRFETAANLDDPRWYETMAGVYEGPDADGNNISVTLLVSHIPSLRGLLDSGKSHNSSITNLFKTMADNVDRTDKVWVYGADEFSNWHEGATLSACRLEHANGDPIAFRVIPFPPPHGTRVTNDVARVANCSTVSDSVTPNASIHIKIEEFILRFDDNITASADLTFDGTDYSSLFHGYGQLSTLNLTANSPGLWALAPVYQPRLIGSYAVAVGVEEVDGTYQLYDDNTYANRSASSACGIAKNWCLAAPASYNYPVGGGTTHTLKSNAIAASYVSGALALLRSRHPHQPMSVALAILFETADDIGAEGIDDVFGHGLLNIHDAIHLSGEQNLILLGHENTVPTLVLRDGEAFLPAPNPANDTDYNTAEYQANPALAGIRADVAYQHGYYGQGVTVGIAGTAAFSINSSELSSRVVDGVRYSSNWITSNAIANAGSVETSLAQIIGGAKDDNGGHGVAISANLMPIEVLQGGANNWTAAFNYLWTADVTPDVILLKDWGSSTPYRITGEYKGTVYSADIPRFRTFLDDNYNELGNQFSDDTALVVPAGNQGWNSVGDVYLCPQNQSITHYCLAGNGNATLSLTLSTGDFIADFKPSDPNINHLYTLATNFGADDSHGISYLPLYHANFLSKLINVVAVTVNGGVTVIASHSNACGNTKNWCLAAPHSTTDTNLQTESAAAHVAGALAVLKSREPSMPMSVAIALLFATADEIGEGGIDSIYGRGLLNLGKAATVQGRVELVVAEESTDPNVVISLVLQAATQVTALVTATDGKIYTLTLSNPADATLTLGDTSEGHYAITLPNSVIVTMVDGSNTIINLADNVVTLAFSANFDPMAFAFGSTMHFDQTVEIPNAASITISTDNHGYYIPDNVVPTLTISVVTVTDNFAGTLTLTDITQVLEEYRSSITVTTRYYSTIDITRATVYTVDYIIYRDWQGNNTILPASSSGNSGGNVGGGGLGLGLSDLLTHQLQALGVTIPVTIGNYKGEPVIHSDASLIVTVYDSYFTLRTDTVDVTHYLGGYITVSVLPYHLTNTFIGRTEEVGVVVHTDESGKLTHATLPAVNTHALSGGVPISFNTAEYQRQRGLAAIRANIAYERGYFGQGVTVMVIDTGVEGQHADLTDQLVAGLSMGIVNGVIAPQTVTVHNDTGNGHGTFAAGIIAARLNGAGIANSGIHGVAPDAKILPANVVYLGANYHRRMVQFALTTNNNQYRVPIINNSWGRVAQHLLVEDGDGNRRRALVPALEYFVSRDDNDRQDFRVFAEGIADDDTVLVFASGNDWWNTETGRVYLCPADSSAFSCRNSRSEALGSGYSTVAVTTFLADYSLVDGTTTTAFSGLGINPNDSQGYALMPNYHHEFIGKLVNVVAVDIDSSSTVIANFSNGCGNTKNWCLAAPGVSITSLASGGGITGDSGTSFAAPHVSGALAVLKSRFPSMPMSVVLAILFSTADDLGDVGIDDIYGHGMLNLGRAATVQGSVSLVLLPPPPVTLTPRTVSLVGSGGLSAVSASVATTIDAGTANEVIVNDFSAYAEYTSQTVNASAFNRMGVAEAFNRGYFGQSVTVANIGPLAQTNSGNDDEINSRITRVLSFLSATDNATGNIVFADDTAVDSSGQRDESAESDASDSNALSYGALVALGGGIGSDSSSGGTAGNVMGIAPSVSFIHAITETNRHASESYGVYRDSVLAATRFLATSTSANHDVQIINNHWVQHADWRFTDTALTTARWAETMAGVYEGPNADGDQITATLLVSHLPSLKGLLDTGKSHNSSITNLFKVMADNVFNTDRVWVYGADEFSNWHEGATISACALTDANGDISINELAAWAPHCSEADRGSIASNTSISIKIEDFIANFSDNITSRTIDGTDYSNLLRGYGELSALNLTVNSPGLWGLAPVYDNRLLGSYVVAVGVEEVNGTYQLYDNDVRYGNKSSSAACGIAKNWCLAAPASFSYFYGTDPNDSDTLSSNAVAASYVSGALALLRSRHPAQPMSVALAILFETTDDIGDVGVDDVFGRGLVNISAAIHLSGQQELILYGHTDIVPGLRIGANYAFLPAPTPDDSINYNTGEYRVNSALASVRAALAYDSGYFGQSVVVGIIATNGFNTNSNEFSGRVVDGLRYDSATSGWVISNSIANAGSSETSLAQIIGGAKNDSGSHGIAPSVNLMPIEVLQDNAPNWTAAVSHLFTADIAPDVLLLKDWKINPQTHYRITGTYNGRRLVADIPHFRGLLGNLDDNYAALGAQFTVDTALVVPAGDQNWSSQRQIWLCFPDQPVDEYCNFNSNKVFFPPISTDVFIRDFKSDSADMHHLYTLYFGEEDSQGIAYLPTYHANFLDKFINVVAVEDDPLNTGIVIASQSNSCGNTKNWCMAAPHSGSGSQTDSAASHVAGALAVLKSRFPQMPMSVVIDILFEAADNLGAGGVDDIYGHGLLNLGKAATLQGSVNLVVTELSPDANVVISLVLRPAAQLTVEVTATDGVPYTLTISNPADTTLTLYDTSEGHYAITLPNSVIVTMVEGSNTTFTLANNVVSAAFSANFDPLVFNFSSTAHVDNIVTTHLATTLTISGPDHGHYIPDGTTPTLTVSLISITTNRSGTLTITDINQVPDDHQTSISITIDYVATVSLTMDIYTVSAITYLDWQGNVITLNSASGNSGNSGLGNNLGGDLGSGLDLSHSPNRHLKPLGITLPVTISNYAGQTVIHSDASLNLTIYAGYVSVSVTNTNVTHYLGGYYTVTNNPDIITLSTFSNLAASRTVGLTIGLNQGRQLAYAILPQANSHANSGGAPIDFNTAEYQQQSGLANISAHLAYERGYFGQGVTVMVIDSGVDGNHPDIASRIATIGLTVSNSHILPSTVTTDNTGHGTFVAGIIAARMNGSGVHGVAPDAFIFPAQINRDRDYGRLLQYALNNTAPRFFPTIAPIINNSWGADPYYLAVEDADGVRMRALVPDLKYFTDKDDLLRENFQSYADAIVDDDTVLVFGAGNDYWNSETGYVRVCPTDTHGGSCQTNPNATIAVTTFLADYSLIDGGNTLSFADLGIGANDSQTYALMPHYHHEFIGKLVNVVAVDSDNVIANFSNGCGSTRNWCLAAPGVDITSLDNGGTTRIDSGTSFAAPHVSGALAVLKSRFPTMPMSVVLAILFETADDLGDEGIDGVYGHGLVNLGRAATVQGSVSLALLPPYVPTPKTVSLIQYDQDNFIIVSVLSAINNSVATNIDGTLYSNFSVYSEYTNLSNSVYFNQMNVAEAFNRGYFGQGVTVANIGPLARTGGGGVGGLDDEIHNRIEHTLTFLSSSDNKSGAISVGLGDALSVTIVHTVSDKGEPLDTPYTITAVRERDATGGGRAHSYGALAALGGGLGSGTNTGSDDDHNVMGTAPSVSFIQVVTENNNDLNNYSGSPSTFEVGIYRESVLEATRFMATTADPDHDVQIINNHWIMHADWRFETSTNLDDPRWYESMAGVYEGPNTDGEQITATLLVSHIPSLKGLLDSGKSNNSSITNLFKAMADNVERTDKVWVYGADEFSNWHEGVTLSACSLGDANGDPVFVDVIPGFLHIPPTTTTVGVARAPSCFTLVGSLGYYTVTSNTNIDIRIEDFIAYFDDNITANVTVDGTAQLIIDGTDYSSLFHGYGQLSALSLTANSPGLWALAPVYQPGLIGSYVVAVGVTQQIRGAVTSYHLYDDNTYANRSASSACGIAKNWCLAAPAAYNYSVGDTFGTTHTLKSNAIAASYVSGALALLRSRHPAQPMSVALAILFATAQDIGAIGVDDTFGHGLVDITAAIHLSGEQTLVLYGHQNTVPHTLILSEVGPSVATNITTSNGGAVTSVTDFTTYAEYKARTITYHTGRRFISLTINNDVAFNQMGVAEALNRGYFGQSVTVANIGPLARTDGVIGDDRELSTHNRIQQTLTFLSSVDNATGAIVVGDGTALSVTTTTTVTSTYQGNLVTTTNTVTTTRESDADGNAPSYAALVALGGGVGYYSATEGNGILNIMGVAPSVNFIHVVTENNLRRGNNVGVYRESVLEATRFMATSTASADQVQIINNHWIQHADWRYQSTTNLDDPRWYETMAGVYEGPDADGTDITATLLVSHLPSLKGLLDSGKSHNSSIANLFATMADNVASTDRVWVYGADEFSGWHEGATISACPLEYANGAGSSGDGSGGLPFTYAWMPSCVSLNSNGHSSSNASIHIKIEDFIAYFDDNLTEVTLTSTITRIDSSNFFNFFTVTSTVTTTVANLLRAYGELSTLSLTVNSPGLWGLAPVYQPRLIGSYAVAVGVTSQIRGAVTTYHLYDDDSSGTNRSASAACGIAKNWCLSAPATFDYPYGNLDSFVHQNLRSNAIAASYVSGALALLRSRHPNQPMSVALAILFATAKDIGAPGVDDVFGRGLVDISSAIHLSGEQDLILYGHQDTVPYVAPTLILSDVNASVAITIDAGTANEEVVTDFATYSEYIERTFIPRTITNTINNADAFNLMGVAEALNRGYYGQGVTVANIGPLARGEDNIDNEISARIERVISFLPATSDATTAISVANDETVSTREGEESDGNDDYAPSYAALVALGGGLGAASNTGSDDDHNVMGVAPSVSFIHVLTENRQHDDTAVGVYRESVLQATRFMATSTATDDQVQIINNHWIQHADWRYQTSTNLDDPRWYETMAGVYEGPNADGSQITATLLVSHIPSLKGLLDSGKSHNSSITNLFKTMADNVESTDRVWVYGADEFSNWHEGATISACDVEDANGAAVILGVNDRDNPIVDSANVAWVPSCSVDNRGVIASNANIHIKIEDFIAHFDDNITEVTLTTTLTTVTPNLFGPTYHTSAVTTTLVNLLRGYGDLSALSLTVNSPGLWGLAPVYQPRLIGSYAVAVGVTGQVNAGVTTYHLYDDDSYSNGNKSSSAGCGIAKNWCLSAPATFDYPNSDGGAYIFAHHATSNAIAASYVSGALALLRSRHPAQPMSVALAILFATAKDIGAPGVDDVFGHGLVDISTAIHLSGEQNLILYGHQDTVPRTVTLSEANPQTAITIDAGTPNAVTVTNFTAYAEYTNQTVNASAFNLMGAAEAFNRGYFGQDVTVANIGPLARGLITDGDEIDNRLTRALSFVSNFPDAIGNIFYTDENSIGNRVALENDSGNTGSPSYGALVALGGGLGQDSDIGNTANSNVMGVAPSVSFIHVVIENSRYDDNQYGIYRDALLTATRFMATTADPNHQVQIVNNHWIMHANWRFERNANLDAPRWYESMAGVYEGPNADGEQITATLLVSHIPSLQGLLDSGKSHNSSLTALFEVMAGNVANSDKVWVYGADEFSNWHAGATLSVCHLTEGNGNRGSNSNPSRVGICPDANATIDIKIEDFIANFNDNISTGASLTFDGTDFSNLFRGYGRLSTLRLTVNSPGLWGLAPVYQQKLIGSYVVAVGVEKQADNTYQLYDGDTDADRSSSAACGAAKNWCLSAPANFQYFYGTSDSNNAVLKSNAAAASYVSGALALLSSRYPHQPMSIALDILFHTATDIGEEGIDDIFGLGLVNISAAINLSGEQILTFPANSNNDSNDNNDNNNNRALTALSAGGSGNNSSGSNTNPAHLLINSTATLSPALFGLQNSMEKLSIAVQFLPGRYYNMPISGLLTTALLPSQEATVATKVGKVAESMFAPSTNQTQLPIPFADISLQIVRDNDDSRPLQIAYSGTNLQLSYNLCATCTDTYNIWDSYGFTQLNHPATLRARQGTEASGAVIPAKAGISSPANASLPFFATDQEHISAAYQLSGFDKLPIANNFSFIAGIGMGKNINDEPTHHHYGLRYQEDLTVGNNRARFYGEYSQIKEQNGLLGGATFAGALSLIGDTTDQYKLGLAAAFNGWLFSADYEYGHGSRKGIAGGLIETLTYRYQGYKFGLQKDGVFYSKDRLRIGAEKHTNIDKGSIRVRRGVLGDNDRIQFLTETAAWQNPSIWSYHLGYGIKPNDSTQIGIGIEHLKTPGLDDNPDQSSTTKTFYYRLKF